MTFPHSSNNDTKDIPCLFTIEDISLPGFVGQYQITNGFNISCKVKPSLLKRFFTKLLLGWIWIDNKKNKL